MLRLQRVGGCMQGLGSIKENICYREAVNRAGETERLELDVDLPENDLREAETSVGNSDGADQEGQPVILWVHGGALVTGDKAAYYDPCVELSKKLAAEGYPGVRINYRLNPKFMRMAATIGLCRRQQRILLRQRNGSFRTRRNWGLQGGSWYWLVILLEQNW